MNGVHNLYVVEFDFRGEQEGELTVSAGDLVRASSSPADSRDGWSLAETVSPPVVKGYVPSQYLRPAEPSAARVADPQPPLRHGDIGSGLSPTTVSAVSPVRRLSDPRLPRHLQETLGGDGHEIEDAVTAAQGSTAALPAVGLSPSISSVPRAAIPSPRAAIPSPLPASPSPTTALTYRPAGSDDAAAADFQRLFDSHDKWFETVTLQRSEASTILERSIADLGAKISSVQGRNNELISKLSQLDRLIEGERKQWKETLDGEKADLAARIGQMQIEA